MGSITSSLAMKNGRRRRRHDPACSGLLGRRHRAQSNRLALLHLPIHAIGVSSSEMSGIDPALQLGFQGLGAFYGAIAQAASLGSSGCFPASNGIAVALVVLAMASIPHCRDGCRHGLELHCLDSPLPRLLRHQARGYVLHDLLTLSGLSLALLSLSHE